MVCDNNKFMMRQSQTTDMMITRRCYDMKENDEGALYNMKNQNSQ